MSKREKAIAAGAIAISYRQLACMSTYRKLTKLPLPKPEQAEEMLNALFSERRNTNSGSEPETTAAPAVNMET